MSAQDVTVKTEKTEEVLQPVLWKQKAKNSAKNKMEDGAEEVPAEICVVIGENRNQQNIGGDSPDRHTAAMSRETSWSGGSRPRNIPPRISTSSPGSYECGICRKKYTYYNCFQTHVRAHIDNKAASVEGVSQQGNNFRYTCDVCGKKYKYYSCFQEHRDLHAVDDTYIHMMVTSGDIKEEDLESCVKLGPKTGNYMCEFCGKQYKYYTPYQEHVALHTPIKSAFNQDLEAKQPNNYEEANSNSQHSSAGSSRTHAGMSDMVGGSGGGSSMTNWQKEATSPMTSSSFPLMQGKGWKKKMKRKEETNNKSVKEEKSGKVEGRSGVRVSSIYVKSIYHHIFLLCPGTCHIVARVTRRPNVKGVVHSFTICRTGHRYLIGGGPTLRTPTLQLFCSCQKSRLRPLCNGGAAYRSAAPINMNESKAAVTTSVHYTMGGAM